MTARLAAEDAARLAVFQLLHGAISLPHPFIAGQPDTRVVPVLDDAEGELPYIALGASWEVPNDDLKNQGTEVVISVHTWSDYNGFAEVGLLNRRVVALLDRPDPLPDALAGWSARQSSMRVTETRSFRDEDPRYRHGVVDVTVRLTQLED